MSIVNNQLLTQSESSKTLEKSCSWYVSMWQYSYHPILLGEQSSLLVVVKWFSLWIICYTNIIKWLQYKNPQKTTKISLLVHYQLFFSKKFWNSQWHRPATKRPPNLWLGAVMLNNLLFIFISNTPSATSKKMQTQ